jgi:hypothetical protein
MPFIQKGDVVLKNDDLLKKSIAPEELYDAI